MPHPTLQERIVPFQAGDGMALRLVNVRGAHEPTRGPVVLVHGAGVRASIFRAPVPVTVVDYLVAQGWDVWLLDWRASIEVAPNPWTLDQAAVHDHPRAIRTILAETGADTVKALVHCQGSCSFVMSVVAGLVPEVDTVVSNAVSLHPVVPVGSRVKLAALLPMVGMITDYIDPRWGDHAPTLAARAIVLGARLTHHACDNGACRMVSFTYGSGDPALWRHENLSDATHEWIRHEFGAVPVSFFRQMAACVRAGRLVRTGDFPSLPGDFAAQPPRTEARFALIAGERNQCFLPESQVATYDWLNRDRKNHHALHVLPGYSHLDVFLGSQAARDVFPLIHTELAKPTHARQPAHA